MSKKRAIISVWNKEGVLELAKFLHENNFEIISTGGTAKIIKNSGIETVDVSNITQYNEIMDGRVKTLHPSIFGGILADRENSSHIDDLNSINSNLFDLVVINLYPFKKEAVDKKLDLKDAINFIDIGGPSMLRAAAKNFMYVIPLCDPSQYAKFIQEYKQQNGSFTLKERAVFAEKVFNVTAEYDRMINEYFSSTTQMEEFVELKLSKEETLRYGENPHQKSVFYLNDGKQLPFEQLSGKTLSYNNYFDIESSISIVLEFDGYACSIIKHSNPCGFGLGKDNMTSYHNAVKTDSVSYFGGIVAFNKPVDDIVAHEMHKSFLECIAAPSFSEEAVEILTKKKNLRLIKFDENEFKLTNKNTFRSVFNGVLFQDRDSFLNDKNDFDVVTKRKPTEKEFNALILGWKLVKFVKSNAVVFNNDMQLLGVGAGQMSRIDSVKIAIRKSQENKLNLKGSILASDAFFPFSDSLELAAKEGIVGVIQPGGSIKDQEVIDFANELNLFMVFTKERHFYH